MSILVKFEFFTPKCIKTLFIISQNLGTKLPLLSKVEPRKSMPIQKIINKTSKKHVKSRGLQLLYDQNLRRKTNQKSRKVTYEVLNDRNFQTKQIKKTRKYKLTFI